MALEELNRHLRTLKVQLEVLAERYIGDDLCNEVKIFADNHPFVVTVLLLTLLFSAIPITFFICFAIITTLISLICFLCIEGFLLLIGGLLLVGVISFVAVITGGAVMSFAVAFWFAQKFHSLCCQHSNASRPQLPATPAGEETQDADSSQTLEH